MASLGICTVLNASEPRHDVAIVGGGLVGASLAIALARIGVDVALIEVNSGDAPPPVFDQRNLSFAEVTVNALTALGVLQKLQLPPAPIQRIHISRSGDFGRVLLQASKYARQQFGQVIVASDFGQALEARVRELSPLTRYRPARFLGFSETQQGHRGLRIATDSGEQRLQARLVVAADGTQSNVRAALGIGTAQYDYRQTLFVTRLRAEHAPDGTAWERLGDDGPTALLPRGDRHYGAVHAVTHADADSVAALDQAAFLARLQHVFGWRAGRFLACGPRSRYPIMRVLAQQTIAPQAVLVGNAAQTVHPLGAQGFNLGLRDALTLAELIEHGGLSDIDAMLQTYVRRRGEDRKLTLQFSDGLARLSSNPAPLARAVRALGLATGARVPALQAMLVGGAMGYRGQIPALCRNPNP